MLSAFVGFCLFFGAVVLLPILLMVILFKIVVALIVIPFRLAGGLLSVLAGIGSVIGTILFGLLMLVMIPLAPILVLFAILWLVFRMFRGPRTVGHPA